MTAPFAPPPNRLQILALTAFPAVFVAIPFLRSEGVLGYIAFALVIYANIALWGSMLYGFIVTVVLADRDPDTLESDVDDSEAQDSG
ncbi:hypothetical protein CA54_46960 [Symmachiella macrocystis]|uniref:Uncharacterized protein n=1 Tax=Symmachiella macrocystis TaxID=2527985 RepID=A0A5C6BG81_9PLAN|nr:hypothetical protein CA54_46960 [Symmachiella macrocystis]